MRYAMISQPMRGKSKDEIREIRANAITNMVELGFRVLDNTNGTLEPIEEEHVCGVNIPLHCLGESLKIMALCDAVLFCEGWEDARGCRIEHEAAEAYGLEIYYMRDPQRVTIESVVNGEKKEMTYFDIWNNGVSSAKVKGVMTDDDDQTTTETGRIPV